MGKKRKVHSLTGRELREGLRVPGLSAFEQVTNDATKVSGEIQDEGSGADSSVSQLGRQGNREIEPSDSRHGELFRHELLDLCEAFSKA